MASVNFFRRTRIAQEVTASVLALSLAAPLSAAAQQAETSSYGLEEIVVTA